MAEHDGPLVLRTLAGDRSAFEALVGSYLARAEAVAAAVVNGDRSAVDDVVQEAFVLAYRKLDKLSDPERFGRGCCVSSVTRRCRGCANMPSRACISWMCLMKR